MKKILLALLTLISIISYSQTTGYLRYDSVRIMKAGANSNLIIESATRDSLGFLYNYGNGRTRFEVVRSVPGGIKFGDDTLFVATPVCNQLSVPISITYISGFDFAASEGSYNINCVPYNSDSATFRLDTADDDYDRYDVFYADETGVHVLKGIAEELATIPSLEAGQLFIAWVRIPANAITPAISYVDIYKENIEWTGTQSGATADFDNTSNVYMGSKAVNWSTVGNADHLLFTNGSAIDLGDYDAISLFIRNKQVVASGANLFARWYDTNTPVSNEVLIPINKATVGSYQAISIPLSLFTIQNYNANRLRIIYRHSSAATNTGFYIDNIFLESGLVLPGGPGNDVSIVSNIPAITVQESNDNFTFSANGNPSQYWDGTGALRTFNAITAVGVVNSETKSTNGAGVNGTNLILQDVDASFRGLVTPTMKLSWDSVYTVEELSNLGYPIMIPIDEARTGFKRIVFDNVYKNTDSTIHIDTTGGGAAQRFGFATEDDAAAENRDFATGENQFRLHSNDGSVSTFLDFWDVGNLKIGSDNVGSEGSGGHFNFGAGIITVNNIAASSVSSLKMLAIDTAGGSNILYTTAIPAGGATPNLQEVTDEGAETTNPITTNSYFSKPSYTSNWTASISFTGNGTDAYGALILREFSTGAGNTVTLSPLDMPGDIELFLPEGNTGDTLLTKREARTMFGGGGSDGNFAENDLTFDGNRTHALAGNTLSINQGANSFLGIDPTAGSEASFLRAYNTTDDDNVSTFLAGTQNTQADFTIVASFNNNVKLAGITGQADATTATLIILAEDGITFTGNILPVSDNSTDIGDATNSFQDGYFRILHLDGSTSGSPTIFSDALGNTALGTNLSGTGTIPFEQHVFVRSDETLVNSTADQDLFSNTAHNTITIQANTTYMFWGTFNLDHSTTSHSLAFGMTPTTATITNIAYNTLAQVSPIGTTTSTQLMNRVIVTTTVPVNGAGANGQETVIVRGWFTVGATGGTISPTIKFSADPTGTILLKAGAEFHVYPVGNNTFTEIGAWN